MSNVFLRKPNAKVVKWCEDHYGPKPIPEAPVTSGKIEQTIKLQDGSSFNGTSMYHFETEFEQPITILGKKDGGILYCLPNQSAQYATCNGGETATTNQNIMSLSLGKTGDGKNNLLVAVSNGDDTYSGRYAYVSKDGINWKTFKLFNTDANECITCACCFIPSINAFYFPNYNGDCASFGVVLKFNTIDDFDNGISFVKKFRPCLSNPETNAGTENFENTTPSYSGDPDHGMKSNGAAAYEDGIITYVQKAFIKEGETINKHQTKVWYIKNIYFDSEKDVWTSEQDRVLQDFDVSDVCSDGTPDASTIVCEGDYVVASNFSKVAGKTLCWLNLKTGQKGSCNVSDDTQECIKASTAYNSVFYFAMTSYSDDTSKSGIYTTKDFNTFTKMTIVDEKQTDVSNQKMYGVSVSNGKVYASAKDTIKMCVIVKN